MLFDDEELPLQIKIVDFKKRTKSSPSSSSATPSVNLGMVDRV
jgi:hypothetical protein